MLRMDDKEKRTRQLMIRLSTSEGTVLDGAARKLGLPTGTWLRSLGMAEARRMAAKDAKSGGASPGD